MQYLIEGHKGSAAGGMTEFGGLEGKIKQEPPGPTGLGQEMSLSMMSHAHQGMFLDESPALSNVELANILQSAVLPEKSSKRQHKRKTAEDAWKTSKRKIGEDSELLLETSSSDSTSRSTPLSQEMVSEIATPNSALGFHSDLELSGLDPSELIGSGEKGEDFDNIDELGDVEEMLAKTVRKVSKSPSLSDIGDKSLVAPSVSITPIPTSTSPGYNQSGTRPGIEIIPISTASSTVLPSSITITPISSSQIKEERTKEKKSSKRSSDDKNRLEKRKKRKRDESSMGPPDKLPPKQDPLTKPVTVSIKPAESPPLSMTPTSPGVMRKFSPSPTQNRSLSGKLSPSMLKPGLKSSASHHSPKHSPAHVPSSPKHGISISSPKSHGTSPKHPSTSGSGKPSMSTLKSAANSPSSKSSGESSKKLLSKDSREKDRKLSSVFTNCVKTKTPSVKLKQLDTSDLVDSVSDNASDSGKSGNLGQVRNRKGSLSAVIDKLKSAQHCDVSSETTSKSGSNRERAQISLKISESGKSTSKTSGETKNSEYMVKPSSDGMKLTINKTRMKETSKSGAKASGTGSPKTHTGLKPGVNSGPASKKPQQSAQKSAGGLSNSVFKSSNKSGSAPKSGSSSSAGSILNKSSSKLSGSPKMNSNSSDLSKSKDRLKANKSSSEKSIFTSREGRKSSPTQNREESDNERAYKLGLSKIDPYSSSVMMEGLMKQLDKNFQIPKLSARTSDDKKLPKNETVNNINRNESSKMFDATSKTESKYPLAIPSNKMFDNVDKRNNISNNPLSLVSPKLKDSENISEDKKKETFSAQNLTVSKDSPASSSYSKSFTNVSEPLSLSTKTDIASKFVAPLPKDDAKKDAKCEGLLDFSGKSERSNAFPTSPSVSVHIVKSPAPSPLVAPSPHSVSPSCITDDELMDEALVGLGK